MFQVCVMNKISDAVRPSTWHVRPTHKVQVIFAEKINWMFYSHQDSNYGLHFLVSSIKLL
jgi:hypothetical protein